MHQSREAHHPARPLHSPGGARAANAPVSGSFRGREAVRLTRGTERRSGSSVVLTEVIVEESGAGSDRQSILQFMTTEHLTLQTARAVANGESHAYQ
jgi:hypothetical protein